MSWLDDLEAADPAYPDPDSDPWAAPGYMPPRQPSDGGEPELDDLHADS